MIDIENRKIKVLVVDDSAFMRKIISDILNSNDRIEVIDTARNGSEAISKAIKLKPDIVTLDIEMPIMNGLDALPEIIKAVPTAKIIMFSSMTKRGADETIKALELGAVDFITKPSGTIVNIKVDDIKDEIINTIIQVNLTKKINNSEEVKKLIYKPIEKTFNNMIDGKKTKYIVAIGISTGGPRALQDVIPYIPEDIPATFLIVQHMPAGFTKSLAVRLNNLSKITVKEAEDGDILKIGTAYIAPGNYHMVINRTGLDDYVICLNSDAPVSGHRPSVNVMMDSISKIENKNLIAVMMTGMGSDGSEGMKKIKMVGGKTIAQDEESCVVYGMPKAVVNAGIVDSIVPLNRITSEILKYMGV